ncbi:hypothetical protein MMC07_004068 [Pseudocyphellaria aurata]|nr:hypothetical protein [Pseudocyphellaria aurata]
MEGFGSSSDAQSNLDPSLASPTKAQLKKQRKRDRKRAKWLAANPDANPDSVLEDPNTAKSEDTVMPTGSERVEHSDVVKHESSDVDDQERRLDDPVVAEPDRPDSAFEEYASAQSDDTDSQAEFYTPPESSSRAEPADPGLPVGTSDLLSSEGIAPSSIKSELVIIRPQTSGVLDDVNSRNVLAPNLTSSSESTITDVPTQVNPHTLDQSITAMDVIDEQTTDSSPEQSDTGSSSTDVATDRTAMELKWAYATHTPADNVLLERGITLYEKPPGYFQWQPYVWKRNGLGIEQAPVVIDTLGDTTDIPSSEFDNQVLYLNTHMDPWADIRAENSHPDALPPSKLVEYQAVESMGLIIWRHDRDLLDCRLIGCQAKLADHNPESVFCLGCGPRTIIRYCSVAHMVADLKNHWSECGHKDLVIKRVVDHTTAPTRFNHLCPAIRNSQNTTSYVLYRQGFWANLNHGRYTLFDLDTEEPTALVWTKDDLGGEEMERRVERLLNFALFDHRNKVMVGLLFRLLRQCLQLNNSWLPGTENALKKQFREEFGLDAAQVEQDRVCECEWVGEGLAEALHLPACKRLYRRFGRDFHATGMKGYLEMYESRYWILRAWQRQHATVAHWTDRAAGEGFEGEIEGTNPSLGPGWTGWGADEDDMSL